MTETLIEQPTLDAIESRIDTPALDFPETVVVTHPAVGTEYAHDSENRGAKRLIYITSAETLDPGRADWVGTVKQLQPAPSADGWLDRDTPHRPGASFDRYHGGVVNPTPVNGHYYRAIGNTQFLARYNDDEHAADRGTATEPWTLLRRGGENTWPIPGDGISSMYDWPYIEVAFTEETAVRTAETEEATDAAEETAEAAEETAEVVAEEPAEPVIPEGHITNELHGPTRERAHVEENGYVLLDPELEPGKAYLLWDASEEWSHNYGNTYLGKYLGGDPTEGEAWSSFGHYDWRASIEEVRWSADWYGQLHNIGRHWVRAAQAKPETVDKPDAVTRFEAALAEERKAFIDFNKRANAIAKSQSWCGEYDRIVKGVGMKGRHKKWEIEVAADFTFSDSSPSSGTDRAIREMLNAEDTNLQFNNIDYKGSMDVTLEVEAADEDSADDQVGSSSIEEAIRALLPNISYVDVSDWEVKSTELVDDNDWDDDEDDDEDD